MKKKKIIIIVTCVVLVLALGIGLTIWGMQPVLEQQVTLQQLGKKLEPRFSVPSELPFNGESGCYINYISGHEGVALVRFQINTKKATGYTIILKDDARSLVISTGGISPDISQEDGYNEVGYKDVILKYCYKTSGNDYNLNLQLDINDNTYSIGATYKNNTEKTVLKKDIEFILDKLIK